MKISADMLFRGLSAKFTFAVFGSESADLEYDRPLLLRDGTNLRDDQLYIAEESMILMNPTTKIQSILLYIGSNPERYTEIFKAVYVFNHISLFDLYDAVQSVFSEYENWNSQLQRILNENGDIQEMIDCSDSVFNNPLILYDKDFSSLAYSRKFSDNLTVAMTESRILSELSRYAETDFFAQRRATVSSSWVDGVRSLYVNISLQGIAQYRLISFELNRKFNLSDPPLLEHLSKMLQLALTTSSPEKGDTASALSQIVKNILLGMVTDPYYINRRLSEFGWRVDHEILCIKIGNRDPQIPRNIIILRIQELFPESCVFKYDKSIVVFINRRLAEKEPDPSQALAVLLDQYDLLSGCSNVFTGFDDLRHYFKQAEIAFNLGEKARPGQRFIYFQEVATTMLLDSCIKELPASMVCAPELIVLKRYDAEHNTMYYQTLFAYLKNNLRPVQTIKELFIHRSTLIYRLERIQKITGLDFEDCDNQWYLMLSFKILDHFGVT